MIIKAIIIALTVIVLSIAVFSVINTSGITKTPKFKRFIQKIINIINSIKKCFWKKYQEHQYRKIQKKEEKERLEQERLEYELQVQEHLERERKKQEILRLQIEKQKKEQEKPEIYNKTQNILNSIEKEEQLKTKAETQHKAKQQTNCQNKDFRKQYPADKRCIDGHYVRSKAEMRIDNFFFYNRIYHIYESEYFSHIIQKQYYPDFYLPDYNLYIEFFGRKDKEYIRKKHEKIEAFRADTNIKFEYIEHFDYRKIESKLKEICLKYNIPLKGERK